MPVISPVLHTLLRRLIFIACALLALWLLICAVVGLWLPGRLQRAAADWGKSHGRSVEIGAISINPFRWTVALDNIRLTDSDASLLFAAKSFAVEAQPRDLLRGRIHVNDIELVQPTLGASRKAGGTWNWVRFIEAVRGPDKPEDKSHDLPKLLIDQVAISHGHIAVEDGNEAGPAWLLDPVDVKLNNLSTMPIEGGYHLAAALDDGAKLDWHGTLTLAPLASEGELRLDGLTLARLWPLAAKQLKLAAPQGSLALQARYRFSDDQKLALTVASFSAALTHVQVTAPGEASRFSLGSFRVDGGEFNLGARTVRVHAIELRDGELSAHKSADGQFDWLAVLPADKTPSDERAPAPKPTVEKTSTPAWQLVVDEFALRHWALALHDDSVERPADIHIAVPEVGLRLSSAAKGIALTDIHAQLADIAVTDANHNTPVKLASITLAPSRIDLAEHTVSAGKVMLKGLDVAVSRDKAGKIGLLSMFQPARKTTGPAKPPATAKPKVEPKQTAESKPATEPKSAWHVVPPEVALEGGSLRWQDATTATPVDLALTGLSATVASPAEKHFDATLGGQLGGGSHVKATVAFAGDTGAVHGSLSLDRVPLQPIAPYALSGTVLRFASGIASAALQFDMPNKAGWQVGGSASVAQLAIQEPSQHDPLIGWRNLNVDGLKVQSTKALSVNIDRVRLDTPRLRVKLDAQHNLNLTQLFTPTKATPAATASAPPPPPLKTAAPKVSKPLPQVVVRALVVKSAEVDFADQSLTPGFATRIHDLSGTIQGISTDPSRRSTVTLDGQVDSYGSAKIRGTLAPFAPTDDSVLVLGFQNISVNSFDPYSETFAGWRIEDGRLNVDLRYALKNRQLDGQNHVVIQSLKLGEEVDKPGATHLPLRLALALLEDSDGRVDLNLPVSGRLDDPQFSYGRLIGQAIATVVKKVATAPFRALASMFGHEGFDAVSYAPGQAVTSPPEREKLAKLAAMLAKRPRLKLQIGGTYDPASDGHALARVRVDGEVLTAVGLAPEPGSPIGRPDFDDPATRAAIRNAYAARLGKLALTGKLLKTKDEAARYQGMRDEMIAFEEKTINEATLQALAQQRAQAAMTQLVAENAALSNRIERKDAKTATAGDEGVALDIQLTTLDTK